MRSYTREDAMRMFPEYPTVWPPEGETVEIDMPHVTAGKPPSTTGGIAVDRLRSIIERVERLEDERKALGSDIRDVFQEAKSAGFDVKVVKQLIKLRKQNPADVEEQETLLDIYRRALGM